MKRSCKKTRKNLMLYLTGRLDGHGTREVTKHLAICPSCSSEAADLHAAWELLETPIPDKEFKDITPDVLARIKCAERTTGLMEKLAAVLIGTPSASLGTLIALLALPAGIYLGQNLYRMMVHAFHPVEEMTVQLEDLPLDIFSDFPDGSIGDVYMNLGENG